jgi:pyruvate formate lyase activating enzyme
MRSAASLPNAADGLRIGGLTRCSSIDLPGRLAAVVFLQGCPWRCGYCHNPELLDANGDTQLTWADVRAFLQRRRGLLDAVVFSGGEPTLQPALGAALDEVRALGFQTALHTGGAYPERLAELLPRLDWVGLDVKAPWHRLASVTGAPGSAARVQASLERLMSSGVAYECRTTWHEDLFPPEDLRAMADALAALGVSDWAVQLARGSHAPARVAQQDCAAFAAQFQRFTLRAA